jgi:hypothetical protein
MSPVQLIREFFEANGGRKVTMDEFKALSQAERRELSDAIASQRGMTWDDAAKNYR